MKYALLIYSDPVEVSTGEAPGQPADPGEARLRSGEGGLNWWEYTTAVKESGALLGAEQLTDVASATSVRLRGGERILTDGPFIETKEHLLGFYLLDLPDLDAALDWAAKMPNVGYGTVEIRPVRTGMTWQTALG